MQNSNCSASKNDTEACPITLAELLKAYATATVSLTITIPGDSDTYTDSATITCVQINESWFVLNE